MAEYKHIKVQNGFVRGTQTGVAVTIGATAKLAVSMHVRAKTISNVYESLQMEKSEFSRETWEKIEQGRAGGGVGFFFGLFNIIGGGDYHYYNKETHENIKQSREAQAAAKAFHNTDLADVTIVGELTAVGQSYVPTTAYAWINLTQVTMDDGEVNTAVADNPGAKAANDKGSNKDVQGDSTLQLLHYSDVENFVPAYIRPSIKSKSKSAHCCYL